MSKVPVIGGIFTHTINAPANVKAFLLLLRRCEGTSGKDGYRTFFGGKLFMDMSDHPCNTGEMKPGSYRGIPATAAGAYQFIQGTWNGFKRQLSLPDFSPDSQDKAAIALLKEVNAYNYIVNGNFEDAVKRATKKWASLPFNSDNQNPKSFEQVKKWYKEYGGAIS